MELQSKFLGGMVGLAVGDALGERAFHRDILKLIPAGDKQTLVYTDDTAMAIGIAESLIDCHRIDEQRLGDQFRRNWAREPSRGYAGGPPMIFHGVEQTGESYRRVAGRLYDGKGSLGNGAAMRIAPIGLFYYNADDLYAQAEASSVVTHTHAVGIDAAAVLAKAVAFAVTRERSKGSFPVEQLADDLIAFARTPEMKVRMDNVRDATSMGVPPQKAADVLGRGVEAHLSVPFAIYSFLRHPQSFKDCLFCASGNGGDRDTLAAMACGISGAYLGVEAVPQEWRERLENRAYIERLATTLWQIKSKQTPEIKDMAP